MLICFQIALLVQSYEDLPIGGVALGRVCVQPAKQACLNKEAKMSKISKNVAQVVPDAPLAFFHLYVEM